MTTITGNTYPVKDAIKALGGRWNRDARGWDVPDERADEAWALVNGRGVVGALTNAPGTVARFDTLTAPAPAATGARWQRE